MPEWFVVFVSGVTYFGDSLTAEEFPTWSIVCNTVASFTIAAFSIECFCILGIAVERCIFINFPFKHPVWVTERRVIKASMIVTVCYLPVSFCLVFLPDRWVDSSCHLEGTTIHGR